MTGRDSRVAVVMLTHNRREEVLRSLAQLTHLPEKPSIVVVDNGSTDGTFEAISRLYPHIEVLAAGGNLGAAARNLGVRRVEAPYVALCDDDTWWEPGSLTQAADLFDASQRLAIVTARVLVGPQEEEDAICAELLRSPLPREKGMSGPSLLGFLAGASMVRRSAFLDTGGFEPRFFIGSEEELLAVDLVAGGWWLCYVPDLIVHHYPSPKRNPVARRCYVLRNALWTTWLRRPLFRALRKTSRLLSDTPSWAQMGRGLAAALLGLPWVIRHRRVVPPHVERYFRLLEQSRAAAQFFSMKESCSTIKTSRAAAYRPEPSA